MKLFTIIFWNLILVCVIFSIRIMAISKQNKIRVLRKPTKSHYLLKHNFLLFPKKRAFLQGYKALFFMIFEIRLIDPGRILTKNNVIFTDKYMVIKHLLLSFGIVYWWTKKLHSNLSFKITISIWRYLKCLYLSVIWKMCMLFRSAEGPNV